MTLVKSQTSLVSPPPLQCLPIRGSQLPPAPPFPLPPTPKCLCADFPGTIHLQEGNRAWKIPPSAGNNRQGAVMETVLQPPLFCPNTGSPGSASRPTISSVSCPLGAPAPPQPWSLSFYTRSPRHPKSSHPNLGSLGVQRAPRARALPGRSWEQLIYRLVPRSVYARRVI